MNADKFFEKYSLEEISKKTKISPISLRFIKNKEYEKIPRVKFIGFIKLIEREFNVDLSELTEEFDLLVNTKPNPQETPPILTPQKKEKSIILYLIIVILLIISGFFLYKKTKKQPQQKSSFNNIHLTQNEKNNSNHIFINKIEQNLSKHTKDTLSKNISNPKIITNVSKNNIKINIPKSVTIIPNQKVWYKAINLDNNKSYSYLTSIPHTFKGSNYYIKLGHGNVTIEYGDINITPNTKKIVRILLKDGNYTYVKQGFKP